MYQWVIFLWSLSVLARGESPTCADTVNGRICADSDQSFAVSSMQLANEGNLLLVGTRNFLHAFTTDTLTLKQTVDLSPDPNDVDQCIQQQNVECVNSITLIQQIPQSLLESNATLKARYENRVLVCGTNAFNPRCTIHNLSNISDMFYLSASTDLGFSPYSTQWTNQGALASNGAFYSATNFAEHNELTRLAVSLNPLTGDTSFDAASFDRDPFWVSNTDFVSLHELDDHIYIFGREDSSEVLSNPNDKFGRVMRVCKSDQGIVDPTESIARFKTFQKIRIACSTRFDNRYPIFYYNNLQSTYVHTGSDGSKWLYATFIAQVNGPSGSAICKFSFNENEDGSISNVLSSTATYYKSDGTYMNVMSFDPFSCPGDLGRERTREESTSYLLIDDVVLPKDDKAIYTMNGRKYNHIIVDMYEFDGSTYEVIFVTTRSLTGEIVLFKDSELLSSHIHAQYEKRIGRIILDKNDSTNGLRKLYTTVENFITSIVLGDCGKYSNCKECLESNDPYCAWSNDSQLCINKLVSNHGIQIIEANEGNINICPVLPTESSSTSDTKTTAITTTTTTSSSCSRQVLPSMSSKSDSTVSQCITDCSSYKTTVASLVTVTSSSTVSVTVSVEPTIGGTGRNSQGPTVKEIGELVGVGIGGLILGMLAGILLCVASVVIRNKANHKHSDIANSSDLFMTTEPLSIVRNGSSHSIPTVEQYKISLPTEKTNGNLSPLTPPSISPPMVDDSELEDDVISDLPSNGLPGNSGGRIKKWGIPKGRTPSTRWLRASESSNAGSESPISPM